MKKKDNIKNLNQKTELNESELKNVSGGTKCWDERNCFEKVLFNSKEEVTFIFKPGDIIEAFVSVPNGDNTYQSIVIGTGVEADKTTGKYYDVYHIQKYNKLTKQGDENTNRSVARDGIEK